MNRIRVSGSISAKVEVGPNSYSPKAQVSGISGAGLGLDSNLLYQHLFLEFGVLKNI